MGKVELLDLAMDRFDMWMGIDNQTLIEVCDKTQDTECIQVCLTKLSDGGGTLNMETFGLILRSEESSEVSRYLSTS